MIDEEKYKQLYNQIKSLRDVDRLERTGLDREFLLEILTLKIGRETRRGFYRIPRKRLVKDWKKGLGIVSLARKYSFSPVMLLYIVLQEIGFSKRRARAIINGKEKPEDARIQRELERAWRNDPVYSPSGVEEQTKRGKKGEERIKRWLEKLNIKFETEREIKDRYNKTPDFLLEKRVLINGRLVKWIESKYSIGDLEKVMYDYRRQLKAYMEIWGPGIVIYHLGLLPSAKEWLEDKGIMALERLPRNVKTR